MLLAQIILYFIFFRVIPYVSDKYRGCYIYRDVNAQYIKSTVLNKFIDAKNHNEKTIIYVGENNREENMIFPGYLVDMYDFMNVGDSLIKEKNSIYYRVKSKAIKKDSLFKLETTCKDK